MLSRDQMPDDNARLAHIPVELPHVPLEEIAPPESFLPRIQKYLELEGYEPDDDLLFVRTAQVEETLYYIWSFQFRGDPCFATVSLGPGGSSVGCNENHWGLTPEQFIMADYHRCF